MSEKEKARESPSERERERERERGGGGGMMTSNRRRLPQGQPRVTNCGKMTHQSYNRMLQLAVIGQEKEYGCALMEGTCA